MIKKIKAVFFSATGNTEKAVESLAYQLSEKLAVPFEKDDFTLPEGHTEIRQFDSSDLVIFGVPTYAGRVPNKVLPFVQNLFQGNGAFAVAVVTFGNRSFDNSLSELDSELKKNNFSVLGSGAVVCHHAFANVGTGRPNSTDQEQLASFADAVFEKLQIASNPLPDVPVKRNEALTAYYVPLGLDGKPAKFLKAVPVTDKETCDNCGICAAHCPMGSIDKTDCSQIIGICIKCQSCITRCPKNAKYFDDPAFLSHKAMLEKNYTRAAVSEFFI